MIRLGYATRNLCIPASTNRSLRLANLADEGKLKALIRDNIGDLVKILRWNAEHGVGLFRMGQNIIPFASHPEFPYDWKEAHGDGLARAGELAASLGVRLSMHPGQYINPGSPKPDVVERSLHELRYVAKIFAAMNIEGGVLVLHLGGAYDDKKASTNRFIETMKPEVETLRYLALENDERIWSVEEVSQTADALGIPAITDTLHHALNPGGLALGEALGLSLPTWKARGARPKLHISSQNPAKQAGAHDYAIRVEDWDVLRDALGGREVEGKEQALIPLGANIQNSRRRKIMFKNPNPEEIRSLLESSRTIAVVGLSDKPHRPSHGVAKAMQTFGYDIFPVNPNLSGQVLGEIPYPSLTGIEAPVDIVDVFRRSEEVMPVAREAVEIGAKALWMQLGVMNEEAAEYAKEHGLIIVMDRCIKVDYARFARSE